jgi:hypothetical protein
MCPTSSSPPGAVKEKNCSYIVIIIIPIGLWLNGDSVKCTFGQMAIRSNVLSVKWHLVKWHSVKRCSVKWRFGQMTFRSKNFGEMIL